MSTFDEIVVQLRRQYPELMQRGCCKDVRAPRLVVSMEDLTDHPDLFRCSECGMILDSPT